MIMIMMMCNVQCAYWYVVISVNYLEYNSICFAISSVIFGFVALTRSILV